MNVKINKTHVSCKHEVIHEFDITESEKFLSKVNAFFIFYAMNILLKSDSTNSINDANAFKSQTQIYQA